MFTPEEFLVTVSGRNFIHIHSEKELEEILNYYRQNHAINSTAINRDNWRYYPYIYYSRGCIHGSSSGSLRKNSCIKFEEWAAMAIPQDFKESDKPLSFLFE